MAIELCLFDLDNTLLRTDDLDQFRGQANVGRTRKDLEYQVRLVFALGDAASRAIYTRDSLVGLRARHPSMKWGVFTRSPRLYADTLLSKAYPDLGWDAVVAYEDVRRTKPHGDGVWAAMDQCGVKYVDQVALVGDEKVDVQSAYQAGCWAVLDQSSWESPWERSRYWAMERVPDAVIRSPSHLSTVLSDTNGHLPELEYHVAREAPPNGRAPRLDTINHFFPRPDQGRAPITVMGRLFGEYEDLRPRRKWHTLTDQIHAHKDAEQFPDAWIRAIRSYLGRMGGDECVVAVIPFKPGRRPRLEMLLNQVRQSDQTRPIHAGWRFQFAPDLLAFADGAVSSHSQHLSREQRFANVGQTLRVVQPEVARGKRIVVIDDVTTTGASLLWAHRYLMQAGAKSVSCLSLTKAVGVG